MIPRTPSPSTLLPWLLALVAAGCLILLTSCSGDDDSSERSAAQQPPAVTQTDIDASLDAADQYFRTGDLQKAQVILGRLVEKVPDDLQAHELLGQVQMALSHEAKSRGDVDAADAFMQSAADSYAIVIRTQRSAGLYNSAGMVFFQAGRIEESLAAFKRAMDADPLNPQHPLFTAQLLIQMERYEDAVAALNRALRLDESLSFAHASLGVIASKSGRHDEAIEHILEARAIEPDRIDFRVQEARFRRMGGDAQASIELLAPLGPEACTQILVAEELALAYGAQDRHEESRDIWLAAYQANPTGENAGQAAMGLARSTLAIGERQTALFWLGRARTLLPDATEQLDDLEAEIRASSDQRP